MAIVLGILTPPAVGAWIGCTIGGKVKSPLVTEYYKKYKEIDAGWNQAQADFNRDQEQVGKNIEDAHLSIIARGNELTGTQKDILAAFSTGDIQADIQLGAGTASHAQIVSTQQRAARVLSQYPWGVVSMNQPEAREREIKSYAESAKGSGLSVGFIFGILADLALVTGGPAMFDDISYFIRRRRQKPIVETIVV